MPTTGIHLEKLLFFGVFKPGFRARAKEVNPPAEDPGCAGTSQTDLSFPTTAIATVSTAITATVPTTSIRSVGSSP